MPSSRTRILTAAGELLLEQGRATSMSEVCRRAGVSNGSLFHHFRTRDALVTAVYMQVLDEYQTHLLTSVGVGIPAADGVRAIVSGHYDWVRAHPDDARLLVELREEVKSAARCEDEQPWAAANRRTFGTLASWVGDRVDAGDMASMPFRVWATLVLTSLLGLPSDDETSIALMEALVRAVTVA